MTAARYPMNANTPAVVLKFDSNIMHHGGLGVIRSLGRAGVCVYAVHEDKLAPAANSRYLHGRLRWRPDPGDADRVLAGLTRLAEIIGRQRC
jgi:D-aspartate ligase